MSRYDIAINKPHQWFHPDDGCTCVHRCVYGRGGHCFHVSQITPTPLYGNIFDALYEEEVKVPVIRRKWQSKWTTVDYSK